MPNAAGTGCLFRPSKAVSENGTTAYFLRQHLHLPLMRSDRIVNAARERRDITARAARDRLARLIGIHARLLSNIDGATANELAAEFGSYLKRREDKRSPPDRSEHHHSQRASGNTRGSHN